MNLAVFTYLRVKVKVDIKEHSVKLVIETCHKNLQVQHLAVSHYTSFFSIQVALSVSIKNPFEH